MAKKIFFSPLGKLWIFSPMKIEINYFLSFNTET